MKVEITHGRAVARLTLAIMALALLIVALQPAANAATPPPPKAYPNYYMIAEDGVLTVPAPGVLKNDNKYGRAVIMVRTLGPKHGRMQHNKYGYVKYEPYKNWNGTEYMKYRACYAANPGICGNETNIKVTVKPVNDAPTGVANTYSMKEETTLNVAAPGYIGNDRDIDGDKITGQGIGGEPAHGKVTTNADGSFSYTPNKNFFRTDSFRPLITDGKITTGEVVTVNVANVNDNPVARTERYYTHKNTTISRDRDGGLIYNDYDVDRDMIKILKYSQPAGGRLTVFDWGGFVFTPNKDYTGTTYFHYWIYDGHGGVDYVKDSFIVK